MKKLAIIAVFCALVLPVVASAQTIVDLSNSSFTQTASADPGTSLSACKTISSYGIAGVVGCLIGVMSNALYLIMAASVLYVVWGAFQLMKEEKREEAKNTVLYGIIGLFVMISIWGLVNILTNTAGLGNNSGPTGGTPTSGVQIGG